MKINKNIIFFAFILYGCSSVDYIGEQYLGVKYINNPLGEEKAPDFDPLIRTDAFDCATFVETALANGNLEKLTKIRYKNGNIDFINRNHFIESDWLNNNSDIVENVSHKYGKTNVRTVVINKQNWLKKNYGINKEIKKQTVNLEYLPYSEISEIKNKETLIVLFISGKPDFYDKIGSDLAVVHMGFLLENGKLRHASRKQGCVIDVDFKEYMNTLKQNKNNIGISLVKIK